MRFIIKYKYILALVSISLISHRYVFFDSGVLNSGDWLFLSTAEQNSILPHGIWFAHANFGGIHGLLPNLIFYWLFAVIGNIFSFGFDVNVRIWILLPIVFFTPIFSFLLFKKIFKEDLPAFFSTCIYSFNTFFLRLQLDFLTYAYIWWIFPALLLSVINYFETRKNKYLIYNALLVFLGIVFEIRIMLLVMFFMAMFQITHLFSSNGAKEKIISNLKLISSYIAGVLMHSFWLVPLKMIFQSGINEKIAGDPFVSYFNLLDVLTLHSYSWSDNLALISFVRQPIDLRHFLIPILALVGIFVFKKMFKSGKHQLYYIFFAVALLVASFFGKQMFAPLGIIYDWAFHHIPLFNMYRESSKFYIIVALPLAFFFGTGIHYLYVILKNKNKSIAVVLAGLIIFLVAFLNLQHFFDQKIGGMTNGRQIPEDDKMLESKLTKGPEYSRILWVPIKTRFSFFSENHPYLSSLSLTANNNFKYGINDKLTSWERIFSVLNHPAADRLLDQSAVKYVIVPVDSQIEMKQTSKESVYQYEFFRHYGGNPELFVDELDKIDYLKRTDIGTADMVVYENEKYKPHIYSGSGVNYISGNSISPIQIGEAENLFSHELAGKEDSVIDKISRIIIFVEPSIQQLDDLKNEIARASNREEQQSSIQRSDQFANGLFFKDFSLDVPRESNYGVYVKHGSIIANTRNVDFKIDNELLIKKNEDSDIPDWDFVGTKEMKKENYSFEILVNNQKIETIQPGIIAFISDEFTAPIKTPVLEYRQVNPSKYILNVRGAGESFPLIFSESYNENWKIYAGKDLFFGEGNKFKSADNQGTIQNENLKSGRFYETFFRKPDLDSSHLKINGFANAWWIDLAELEKQGKIVKQADGTYDFSIIIEFQAQKYFYLGIFISGLTMISLLGTLLYLQIIERRNKRD